MKQSLRWRTVLVPVATAAALVAAPLVGTGVAYATDNPYPPHSTGHPYPPKPHEPHEPDHQYPPKPHEPGHGDSHHDGGHEPGKPHLADTGGDSTKELVLGGIAAGLVAAGVGAAWVARRRRTS
ncbi:LPXTG cell wall anchor domain-containing protein [Streptomyces sp. NBC_01353]|uniref:LPXTG cell wall anchor domain-containing protein n=1 Tax=Streptomyces sp. NBC_01353 TaxID=2903835 RepID=UPI002E349789|nr:LPXTG cell wall anchor domain-containing protein [Streptomyces sp. NBC_01353]